MGRQVIAAVVILGTVVAPVLASQARGGASSSPRIRACSLLTKEVVKKFATPESTRMLDLFPPMEEQMGATGSACEYGGVRLQVDPFARREDLRKSPGKDWQSVSGVGDTTFFRANGREYAELMTWSGTHHFTIQMDVPTGSTPEAIKPNTIQLANYLITTLR